jgi:thioredoxin 1
MSETTGQAGTSQVITYELSLTAEEARTGTTKLLTRNGKRLQVSIPPGVSTGNMVKLSNALQTTDNRPGDIRIVVKIKAEQQTAADSSPGGVVEIGDGSFADEVLKSNLPVVVDFWAAWCGPCRMMAPIMEETAVKYQGKFKFCKINVDENPISAGQYQAMSIPMLLFFKNGQVVERSVGAIPASQLYAKLEALLRETGG